MLPQPVMRDIEDGLEQENVSTRLNAILRVFERIGDASFLDRLRETVALLTERNPEDGFREVATALESIESLLRVGHREIHAFLSGYLAAPARVSRHLDEHEMFLYAQLMQEDIEFLMNASSMLVLVADLLHGCAIVCRKDCVSPDEVSETVSRAACMMSTKKDEFQGAQTFILRLLSATWNPRLSLDGQGRIVRNVSDW